MAAPIRADQLLSTTAPITVAGATNAAGTSQAVSRADHQHRLEVAVENAGVAVGQRPTLNFIGTSIVDDAINDRVDITINAMASAQAQEDQTIGAPITTDTTLVALANTPLNSDPLEVEVFLNGVIQNQGAGADYDISGTTVTWLAGTGTGIDLAAGDEVKYVYRF